MWMFCSVPSLLRIFSQLSSSDIALNGPFAPLARSEHMFYSREMSRASHTEISCKSAINRVSGMPFNWSLNPYRGCVHACHYCYARATHSYFGLNADDDFEQQIFVKTNIAEVLAKEVARPSWRFEQIAIG